MTNPYFTRPYLNAKPTDAAGVISYEVESTSALRRDDQIRNLEAKVERLTELLGYAVLQLPAGQQRGFAAACCWDWQEPK